MTREEIISGLQFTIDMFLFDPNTGEKYTVPRNDMDKTTIDACRGAIELLRQEPTTKNDNEQEDITWIIGNDNVQIAVRNMPVDMMQKINAIIGNLQEPTTKNCESCKYYGSHHEVCNYCYKCSLWTEKEPTTKNDLGVDCISRADALRVAKNEYLRGWHNALCKALSEKYSIHCEEGNFSVIQEETITGLGLSMNCALGKDVESYMSTMPSVTPQEPFINKPCVSSGVCEHDKNKVLDKIQEEIKRVVTVCHASNNHDELIRRNVVLQILDKYKAESEG